MWAIFGTRDTLFLTNLRGLVFAQSTQFGQSLHGTMAAPPITINADEVNCLIYAYLKDSGHSHLLFPLCTPDAYA